MKYIKAVSLISSSSMGRIVLHLVCGIHRPLHWHWHWHGIQREFSSVRSLTDQLKGVALVRTPSSRVRNVGDVTITSDCAAGCGEI